MLRVIFTLGAFLTLGAINTVTGAQPNNPGLRGPLNQPIGPLPAMQMPGQVAQTVPVMANFNWILQALQQGTFATVEDETAVLLASRQLVAGSGITFVDTFPETGPGNHATLTISSTGGGGGGKLIFFGVDPPPAGTETDWLAWWNTEEGALKIWYTIAEGDPDSDQWVDAMPARTGPPGTPGSVSPLTTKGDVWGFSTVDARIPVGANGTVLTADSGAALGVSYQAVSGFAPQAALYVTLAADPSLTFERVLTAGTNITLTDGGPGGNITIDASGAASPLTTKGDLFGFTTVDARVPVGTNGQILSADSAQASGLAWIANTLGTVTSVAMTVPGGYSVTGSPITSSGTLAITGPLTTKGDLLGFSTVNVRVPVGTNGQVLSSDSGQASGLSWINAVTGTVTSVALTMPTGFSVAGSPVTSSGTLAVTGGPNASFLTLATSSDLANERVFTAGTGITVADAGAGSTYTVSANSAGGGWAMIQKIVTTGGATSIAFSGIPGTYTDLMITLQGRCSASTGGVNQFINFNGDTTAANYGASSENLTRTGSNSPSSVASSTQGMFVGIMCGVANNANGTMQINIRINNYAGTTFQKPCLGLSSGRYGTSTVDTCVSGGCWLSTAAITSITLPVPTGGTAYVDGTTAVLYGGSGP